MLLKETKGEKRDKQNRRKNSASTVFKTNSNIKSITKAAYCRKIYHVENKATKHQRKKMSGQFLPVENFLFFFSGNDAKESHSADKTRQNFKIQKLQKRTKITRKLKKKLRKKQNKRKILALGKYLSSDSCQEKIKTKQEKLLKAETIPLCGN